MGTAVLVLSFVLTACPPPDTEAQADPEAADPEAAEQEIREQSERGLAAAREGDVETVVAFYSDDVVNAAQGLGARPIDVSALAVDALVGVGFKWLCGPYGTGFCWMRPELLDSLEYNQAYWLALLTEDDLARADLVLEDAAGSAGARRYDVFGTANFFNFKPWAAAVEYLLKRGIDRIATHDQELVSRFIEGLDPDSYDLLSPREGSVRSTLVFVSHRDRRRNAEVRHRLAERGIFPGIAAKRVAGYRGIHLLRRDVEGEVEFTTVLWFDSWETVRAFAGDDRRLRSPGCPKAPGPVRRQLGPLRGAGLPAGRPGGLRDIGVRGRYWIAFTRPKIGRYMATIMPPTTVPRTMMRAGSRAFRRLSTATSTSSS